MFENALRNNLKEIFKVKKVTLDLPGESQEQECLFVDVEKPYCKVADARFRARVQGKAYLFGNADKLTYGYFAKHINAATAEQKAPFFFFDIEMNDKTFLNIVQRSFSFVYFYDSQYDPELGTITSINFAEGEP